MRDGRHLDERYVAPEVWLDPANTTRSPDVYSPGILFHELLTGKTPYQKIMEVYKDLDEKRGGSRGFYEIASLRGALQITHDRRAGKCPEWI